MSYTLIFYSSPHLNTLLGDCVRRRCQDDTCVGSEGVRAKSPLMHCVDSQVAARGGWPMSWPARSVQPQDCS